MFPQSLLQFDGKVADPAVPAGGLRLGRLQCRERCDLMEYVRTVEKDLAFLQPRQMGKAKDTVGRKRAELFRSRCAAEDQQNGRFPLREVLYDLCATVGVYPRTGKNLP